MKKICKELKLKGFSPSDKGNFFFIYLRFKKNKKIAIYFEFIL